MSKKHPPFALEFTFDEDANEIVQSVTVDQADVTEDADTRAALPLVERIKIFLSDQVEPSGEYIPQSVDDIADAVNSKVGTVRARLSENVDKEGYWEKAGTGEYKYKNKEEW